MNPSPGGWLNVLLSLRGDNQGMRVLLQLPGEPEALAGGEVSCRLVQRLQSRHAHRLLRAAEEPLGSGELAAMGEELGAILPAPVRECLASLLVRPGTGSLRLVVAAGTQNAAALPWELLRLDLPSLGPTFLARDLGTPIIRSETSSSFPIEPAEVPSVLVAWADPQTARYGPLAHVETEARAVVAMLRSMEGRVRVETLPYATPAALQRHLRERPVEGLHFIGHGDVRPSGGVLVLHGEGARADAPLYAEELAGWLAGTPLRFVFLSACHSGGPNSVAARLVRSGLPAALGMQFGLRDRWAAEFASVFYGAVFRSGDVAEALAMARAVGEPEQPDWANPALYLSVKNPRLFSARSSEAPSGFRTNIPYRRGRTFVGRVADLERLHAWLTADEPGPVAVIGLGGVGKTQLAVEYVHRHRRSYPGGVFWVNAQDEPRFLEEYAALARFWSIPEELSVRSRAERVRDALHEAAETCLLVVDSVGEGVPLDLLPAVGACRVLLTAREQHAVPAGALLLFPGRLTEREALALILPEGVPQIDSEAEAARRIVELLGGLPLALVLASHHLHRLDTTLSEYHDRLRGNRVAVLEQARRRFVTDTRHDGGLFDAIDLSSRSLSPAARGLLRTACCFSGRRISIELLQRASELADPADFDEALAELRDTCLLSREERGRLGVHELVRVHTLGLLIPGERSTVIERVAGVLLEELQSANRRLEWRSTRAELAHCRSVLDLCRENAVPLLPKLLAELGQYAFQHRELIAAAAYYREALERSPRAEPSVERTMLSVQLGLVEQHLDHPEAALELVRRGLGEASATLSAEDPRHGDLYNSMGYVLKLQKRLDEAEPWYRRALDFNRRVLGSEHPEVASCLNNLGALLEERGDLSEALSLYEEALVLDEAAFGSRHVKAGIRLNNIGRALVGRGRAAEALEYHSRALEIYEEAYGRSHVHSAMTLVFLGDALQSLGRAEEARQHYAECLPILQRYYGSNAKVCRRVADLLQQRV